MSNAIKAVLTNTAKAAPNKLACLNQLVVDMFQIKKARYASPKIVKPLRLALDNRSCRSANSRGVKPKNNNIGKP